MSKGILDKPTAEEMAELNKLMANPRTRLALLKEFNKLMREFFVWREKEENKKNVQKKERGLISHLLEKIRNM